MAEEKLKPYLLAVAVKMAKFVDLPEFKIEINLDETVTAEQYFAVINKTIAAGIWNSDLSMEVQEKIHRLEILFDGTTHCLSRRFTTRSSSGSMVDSRVEMMHSEIKSDQAIRLKIRRQPDRLFTEKFVAVSDYAELPMEIVHRCIKRKKH